MRRVAELRRYPQRIGQPAALYRERAQIIRVALRVGAREEADVCDARAAAGDLHHVGHVQPVGRHLDRVRPVSAVVGRVREPPDVATRTLRVPDRIEIPGGVDADVAVDPPLGERHRPVARPELHGRRPRRAAVGRRREVFVARVHCVRVRVGDVVALVEQVDAAVRLDHHRSAVAAAGRKTRARMCHRPEGRAAVGRPLQHDVEIAGREPAAAGRVTEVGHRSPFRPVVPGDIHGAVGADRDERTIAPVLRIRGNERGHLRERLPMVERRRDDGKPLAVLRPHEHRVDGAVRPDGDGRVPGVVVGADRPRQGDRRVERPAAVSRACEADPLAAHPVLVDVAARRVDSLLDFRIVAGARRRADVVDGPDAVRRARRGERRRRYEQAAETSKHQRRERAPHLSPPCPISKRRFSERPGPESSVRAVTARAADTTPPRPRAVSPSAVGRRWRLSRSVRWQPRTASDARRSPRSGDGPTTSTRARPWRRT